METFTLTSNAVGKTRREVMDGKVYLVAPLTTIVPGVLNGSKGALYYSPEEIKKSAKRWDDIPIVLYHPQDPISGQHLSAKSPGVVERSGMGFLKATTTANGKLQHEGWFDIEQTRRVSPSVMQSLESGKPIELSTGLFTDNEEASPGSSFNGKPYDYNARNYRPDHLAILPDQKGACSLQDGCGVLINKGSEEYEEGCEPFGVFNADGGWVTTEKGQHVYVSDGGDFLPTGPRGTKEKAAQKQLSIGQSPLRAGFQTPEDERMDSKTAALVTGAKWARSKGIDLAKHAKDSQDKGHSAATFTSRFKGADDRTKKLLTDFYRAHREREATKVSKASSKDATSNAQGNWSLAQRSERANSLSDQAETASETATASGDTEDHQTALDAHKEAAQAHRGAAKEAATGSATKAEKDYAASGKHANKAQYHDDKANEHQAYCDKSPSTVNSNPEGINQYSGLVAASKENVAAVHEHAKGASKLEDSLVKTYFDHPAVTKYHDAIHEASKDQFETKWLSGAKGPSYDKGLDRRKDDNTAIKKAATKALKAYAAADLSHDEDIEADRGKVMQELRKGIVHANKGQNLLDKVKEGREALKAAKAAKEGGTTKNRSRNMLDLYHDLLTNKELGAHSRFPSDKARREAFQFVINESGFASEAQRDAFWGSKKEGGVAEKGGGGGSGKKYNPDADKSAPKVSETKSSAASEKSAGALERSKMAAEAGNKSGSKVAREHEKAADAHHDAAQSHAEEGNHGMAAMHIKMAGEHKAAAATARGTTTNKQALVFNTMTEKSTMSRKGNILYLTTNCKCWQGSGDEDTLNMLSDDKLEFLRKHEEKASFQQGLVVNASGSYDGRDEEDEDEEDSELEEPMDSKRGKGRGGKEMTDNEWLNSAPPRVRAAVQNAMEIEDREKRHLIERLTANVLNDKQRVPLLNRLKSKSLAELRELAVLVPVTTTNGYNPHGMETAGPQALYLGAAGAPLTSNGFVNNGDDSEDLLVPPVINWAKEQAAAAMASRE